MKEGVGAKMKRWRGGGMGGEGGGGEGQEGVIGQREDLAEGSEASIELARACVCEYWVT